jgi:hypothetical protein
MDFGIGEKKKFFKFKRQIGKMRESAKQGELENQGQTACSFTSSTIITLPDRL